MFSIGDLVSILDPEDALERYGSPYIVRVSEDPVFGTEYLIRFMDGSEGWYQEDEIADPEEDEG